MTDRLESAINDLYSIDRSLNPLEFSRAREAVLIEGLHALAEHFGKEIEHTYIDSNGDLKFHIEGARKGEGEFGDELAATLSKVATRSGAQASKTVILGQNNWTWLNHFEAEKLLKMVGKELFDIDPDNSVAVAPRI